MEFKVDKNEKAKALAELLPGHLPLMEQFYTIQGEGHWQGHAAYFIRLAGCDVGCVWCDVKESWAAGGHPQVLVDKMTSAAADSACNIAIVTGGEPAMYKLEELTQSLQEKHMRCHIETSGAHAITGDWHWICLSPKKFKPVVEGVHEQAHELKVIVFNVSDFEFAEKHAAKVSTDCLLYLQPEWSKQEEMLPLIVDYVKANPRWRVTLQTHKYMNIP